MIRSVAVFAQTYRTGSIPYVRELLDVLSTYPIEVSVNTDMANVLPDHYASGISTYSKKTELNHKTDLLISVGGDGTLLRSIKYITGTDIPVIGINTGRMGFLATVHKEKMKQSIKEIFKGNYSLISRNLLSVKISGDTEQYYALNEISVSRKNSTSMIQVDAFVNGEKLNRYWADGLIIATPTGSTGYSLSCNGPIVAPDVPAFILTPIAPHSLHVRPLIINHKAQIMLKVKSREKEFLLSMDSDVNSLDESTEIHISNAPVGLKMIQLPGQSFIGTLKEKLLWGSDLRNY